MAFQPRGGNTFPPKNSAPTGDSNSLNSLVDQIADAVRERLLQQGVPTTSTGATGSQAHAASHTWVHLVNEGADRIGHAGETPFQPHLLQGHDALAAKIDHTLLKPEATREEVTRLCKEAREHHFATVCVNSTHVGMAAELLKGSSTKAIAVVGFPLGAAATATKAFEARESVRAGAQEIDMVLNIGALKGREYAFVLEDIRQVVEASRPFPVKVILETSSLSEDQKIIGCALSKAAGAAFVKTSTGFASGGATAEDIALMRRIVGPEMGVKASGGIRTLEDAEKMIAAGANRIGASASVAIVTAGDTKKEAFSSKKDNAKKDFDAKKGPSKPFKNSLY